MLIDFSVKNFLSFKDETVLSLETGERLSRLKKTNTILENNNRLLKNLVIIGPNGSGKTNLLNAIKQMKIMVTNDTKLVTDGLPFNPFELSDESVKNTDFSIRFTHEKQTFEYSFSYQADHIEYEKLKLILKTTEKTYFSRERQSYSKIPKKLKSVADNTKQNSLFLYNAQNANDPVAISVMQWFQNDLIFVDDLGASETFFTNLMKNKDIKEEFLRFLKFADFNIVDVVVRDVPFPPMPEQLQKLLSSVEPKFKVPDTKQELYAAHKKYNSEGDVVGQQEIPLSNESRGTQKIFVIALAIIYAQLTGNSKTLLFDEFDDSLHFELSEALLELFNSEQNRNQFILTTHELQLLNSKLRTDQIYLVEKDFQGKSSLKSIFDFNDSRNTSRQDVQFMKKYIEGRFGALPQIDVNEMLKSLNSRSVSSGDN